MSKLKEYLEMAVKQKHSLSDNWESVNKKDSLDKLKKAMKKAFGKNVNKAIKFIDEERQNNDVKVYISKKGNVVGLTVNGHSFMDKFRSVSPEELEEL